MVIAITRELIRSRQIRYIPRLLLESAAKFIGYQLGKRHRLLPGALCRRFSMHRGIWDKMRRTGAGGATMQG
jgi:rhamnosyltransferase